MMKRLLLTILIQLPLSTAWAKPVETVPRVDLPRYLGTWYEVARLPQFFQRHCLGDVTAQYSPREDGRIGVLNRCRTGKGFIQAKGQKSGNINSGHRQFCTGLIGSGH